MKNHKNYEEAEERRMEKKRTIELRRLKKAKHNWTFLEDCDVSFESKKNHHNQNTYIEY